MMSIKTLEVFAADLPRELWIQTLLNFLIPRLPEGYSLGIEDDEYSERVAHYLADIVVEVLNGFHDDPAYEDYPDTIHWIIDQGNLYSIRDA